MVQPPVPGLDRTSRVVHLRPITAALLVVAGFSAVLAVVTTHSVLGMLTLAAAGIVVGDIVVARAALAKVRLSVTNPVMATVGSPVAHVVDAHGLTQPLELVRPPVWGSTARLVIALRAQGPGSVILDAGPRGVRDHVVFDVVASGPLGLAEVAFRERVWLPVALHVAPAPLPHDPDWPALRTVPLGEAATVTRGDDLFRGVRGYVRGDPRRAIHWPATAHHGTLMVREHDGLEQVALRVVLDLPYAGIDADAAVARAGWLVEEGVARGWLVHLVTVAAPPPPRPGPLGRPGSYAEPEPAVGWGTVTVVHRIARSGDVQLPLAEAGIGTPVQEPWTGMTRIVSPEGDRWS